MENRYINTKQSILSGCVEMDCFSLALEDLCDFVNVHNQNRLFQLKCGIVRGLLRAKLNAVQTISCRPTLYKCTSYYSYMRNSALKILKIIEKSFLPKRTARYRRSKLCGTNVLRPIDLRFHVSARCCCVSRQDSITLRQTYPIPASY